MRDSAWEKWYTILNTVVPYHIIWDDLIYWYALLCSSTIYYAILEWPGNEGQRLANSRHKTQEGTGSVRFVSVPDFSKIPRFGSVRQIVVPGSTRFGLHFSDANPRYDTVISWCPPVRVPFSCDSPAHTVHFVPQSRDLAYTSVYQHALTMGPAHCDPAINIASRNSTILR